MPKNKKRRSSLMKKSIKKGSFTLLELLITLAILAVISALLSMSGFRLWQRHLFYEGSKKIKAHIEYCHKMACLRQCDYRLDLTQDVQGLSYRFFSEESKPHKDMPSHHLANLSFKIGNKSPQQYKILFTPQGTVFPNTPITIISTKFMQKATIDMNL